MPFAPRAGVTGAAYLNAIFNSFANDDAGDEKLLPKGNPCTILKDKKLRKTLKPRERYLDDVQRSSLYDLLGSVKHKDYPGTITVDDADLIWLLIHSGLRLDEARTISWNAVDFNKEKNKSIENLNFWYYGETQSETNSKIEYSF